jgi:hypothetical protein
LVYIGEFNLLPDFGKAGAGRKQVMPDRQFSGRNYAAEPFLFWVWV